jgi:hypothetical protein
MQAQPMGKPFELCLYLFSASSVCRFAAVRLICLEFFVVKRACFPDFIRKFSGKYPDFIGFT